VTGPRRFDDAVERRFAPRRPGHVLLLDNRDSFVFNIVHRLAEVGVDDVAVVRSDHVDVAALDAWRPRALVLSPGPGRPEGAGCSVDAVRHFAGRVPILGICLGHQAIAVAFGARVVRAPGPVHGRASLVEHAGHGLFAGLPSPLAMGRYHALMVDPATVPSALRVDATGADGMVMALTHRRDSVYGLQPHPESILTPEGRALLAAFAETVPTRR
jgi:para-aminobenzoate synthetase component 2